jgi:ribonuclease E
MSKQMLIDAVHQEETRVALINDGRVEDFDFETTGSEQLRGNIYLAKVTRVEPSLQACFVEYGGNRHGFLAFSEIHPDYYQLPQADREALLEEAAREAAESADEDVDDEDDDNDASDDGETSELDVIDADDSDDDDETSETDNTDASSDADEDDGESPKKTVKPAQTRRPRKTRGTSASRRYKIQEVIRRRQVLLVQVVKEERGNKGAALTTYLSLAGRYSVLMPNTPRGGGISRKIPNGNDRKRLKSVMDGLDVPKGMGLIVRTAGAKRTKSEIRRDYDYLQKLWSTIRSKTMESTAPQRIHEEGGLVHRAMRDMFDREIEEVIVQGDTAYREAKDLAKTLMPTQAKKVQRWTSPAPLFVQEGVEDQLDSIFSPVVQMKSGGYLVINQTEALVAIDVNSGKSTKERSIEQTALRTNLEAAEEACRQMRLRDLAGLVVIDFIDMDENKNNRAVEKKMKECLKLDRARVQNNRISQFGLMEISRQRRRAGVMQATSDKCEACDGTGRRRSIPSSALQLLRAVEARAAGGGLKGMTVTAPTDVALYLLNTKRDAITAIEDEAGFTIAIKSSGEMIPGDFQLDAEKDSNSRRRRKKFVRAEALEGDADDHLLPDSDEDDDEDEAEDTNASSSSEDKSENRDDTEDGGQRKRRRRGRRGGRRRKREGDAIDPGAPPSDGGALLDGLALSVSNLLGDQPDDLPEASEGGLASTPVAMPSAKSADPQSDNNAETKATDDASEDGEPRKKRRRRRRKRGRGDNEGTESTEAKSEETQTEPSDALEANTEASDDTSEKPTDEDAPKKRRRRRRGAKTETQAEDTGSNASEATPSAPEPEAKAEPAPKTAPTHAPAEAAKPDAEPIQTPAAVYKPDEPIATKPVLETTEAPKKKKRGWWSR